MDKGEQQLKDLYPKESLTVEIKFLTKKELICLNYIKPDLIKNSIKKSSTKRNNTSSIHNEGSSCDYKKKKQDNLDTETVVASAPASESSSNGV